LSMPRRGGAIQPKQEEWRAWLPGKPPRSVQSSAMAATPLN
jgi:hypothetical protein